MNSERLHEWDSHGKWIGGEPSSAMYTLEIDLGGEGGGRGIGMGNTCKSMADSFQCMTKPTTIL